jgi:hypothetical protein
MASPGRDAVALIFGVGGIALFLFFLIMLVRSEKK